MFDTDEVMECVKEIAKDAYDDGGRVIVKPTGELVSLIPRTIKAALAPLEKWILQREYNVKEVEKLLEKKLENIPPEQIESPQAHIAVPAIQYISYCMDNEELRDMYANLLANSMNKVVKNGVHPGFVEIIKQLTPDEAKMLRYLSIYDIVPTITLRSKREKGGGIDVIKNFSNITELTQCENPLEVNAYFNNLIRLGLLEQSSALSSLTEKSLYEPLKNHPHIKAGMEAISVQSNMGNKADIQEGYMRLTDYGKAFCKICITSSDE